MQKNKREARGNIAVLCQAILSLQTPEECRAFLEDVCTTAEVEEMSRRLLAARMLHSGASYLDVAEETGLSTATISRVSRSLKNGNGYSGVLSRLSAPEE